MYQITYCEFLYWDTHSVAFFAFLKPRNNFWTVHDKKYVTFSSFRYKTADCKYLLWTFVMAFPSLFNVGNSIVLSCIINCMYAKLHKDNKQMLVHQYLSFNKSTILL